MTTEIPFSFPRLKPALFGLLEWDMPHLAPFVMDIDVGLFRPVPVVVTFSCHCFSREPTTAEFLNPDSAFWYDDGRERRVLDEQRYELSKRFLPQMAKELGSRKIQVASKDNFMTIEILNGEVTENYVVYFEVQREGKRLHLRVQSAYLKSLTQREKDSRKVNLPVLLKAVYEGRKIRP